jgi:predicted phage tail protein
MTAPLHYPLTIAGGGGKRGGKSGSGGGTEAPNSLKSRQVARVVDLISEGPIRQIVGWAQGIYLDGVRIQNPDGSLNFKDTSIQFNSGWPDQPILSGFSSQQAETAVNLQLKYNTGVVRTVNNENVDTVRLTFSVPALQYTNKTSGDITGSRVDFQVYIQSNGGGYRAYTVSTIEGKTNTRYQRSYIYTLEGAPPWDIQVIRWTPDSTTVETQNDLYWDSFTEIIDSRVNYTLSAVVGSIVDAEQFQTIPKRVYLIEGLYILMPNNYDPYNRIYYGVWDGNFKWDWTNNPAWVLFDLLYNRRYGIGDFITAAELDKWAFYKIAQWCDGLVPNGRGGYEPRFVCNARITTQQEAFDLLNSFASVFRGFMYWAGGMLTPVADMPSDPVGVYTNANVVDGQFTYTGADIRARHNQVAVTWNDPDNLGEPRITIVEDPESISRLGIQKTDLIAIGCTSESQAIRTGRWLLYTENYEGEAVTFKAGLDSAWSRPGDVIQISDMTISGSRRGGRIIFANSASSITIDSPVETFSGFAHQLSVQLPDGRVETRAAIGLTADAAGHHVIQVTPAFSAAPSPSAIWVLASGDLQPTLWRVTAVKESDKQTVEISALSHRPDKWAYVENNLPLSQPDISNISALTILNLNAIDYLVQTSAISVGVRMLISWTSTAPQFEVRWRPQNGNWSTWRTDQNALDVEAIEGLTYEIEVTAINAIGRRGPTARISHYVTGALAPPPPPQNFRVQAIQGVAMFQWAPITTLDVIIGGSFEMRYSPRTEGATWTSANILLTSIPGTATTVETPYRPGTYFLRTRDIRGIFSTTWAAIVTTGPDTAYRPYVRICEHPEWAGEKHNTIVQDPQRWLIIDRTGEGLWDDQLDPIDDWGDVDDLPIGAGGPAPSYGSYDFEQRIDLGGVFAIRLARDMLAFPITGSADDFVDSRAGLVDDWQDWDNAADPGSGMVTTRIRQTDDDPDDPAAVWSTWSTFIAGEFTGRAFEFQAVLTADPDENVAIEELCILADIANKADQGNDIAWIPSKMTIVFAVKFYSIPSLSIAVQEGVEGDTFRITNKTRESFDLELLNGTAIITGARTFDWIAAGY